MCFSSYVCLLPAWLGGKFSGVSVFAGTVHYSLSLLPDIECDALLSLTINVMRP